MTLNKEFNLEQKVWYHENGYLEGVKAKIINQNPRMGNGIHSYDIEIEDDKTKVNNINQRELRERKI